MINTKQKQTYSQLMGGEKANQVDIFQEVEFFKDLLMRNVYDKETRREVQGMLDALYNKIEESKRRYKCFLKRSNDDNDIISFGRRI